MIEVKIQTILDKVFWNYDNSTMNSTWIYAYVGGVKLPLAWSPFESIVASCLL